MSGNVPGAGGLPENKIPALLKLASHWMVVRKGSKGMIRHDDKCCEEK